ncbi:helix-turn-helix domain-containing protein [Endozoicomonas sp. Mp262]|uniref:LexA family protein n=1 Tax=Endozoicomonas sp. Mp262 TaxID=2919499 RepID=UPI0021D9E280
MDWKERVRQLMKKKGVNQSELAETLGMAKSSVSQWLGPGELSEKNTIKAQVLTAAALGVPTEYLVNGVHRKQAPGMAVPVLDYAAIADWVSAQADPESADWIFCPADCSEYTYATVVQGNAMDSHIHKGPTFSHGAVVYVDPDSPLTNGAVCVFDCDGIHIGEYTAVNGKQLLVHANAQYPAIDLEGATYLGKVLGSYRPAGA